MTESKRILELSGIESFSKEDSIDELFTNKTPTLLDKVVSKFGVRKKTRSEKMKEALRSLTPSNIDKTVKRFNKNIQKTTLSDSFAEAIAKSAVYSFKITTRTIKEFDKEDFRNIAQTILKRSKLDNIKFDGNNIPDSILNKIQKKVIELAPKFERATQKEESGPEPSHTILNYGEWITM